MGSLSDLRTQAIAAAKRTDWKMAVEANQEIISINPSDIVALNRLGMAFLQLHEVASAEETFKQVLAIDATNAIAKKQLEKIDKKEQVAAPHFCATQFIEEPGKSKICQLHRLAGKDVLATLRSGQTCQLKPKTRFISVESLEGAYIGSLPDDISYRLSQLIASGNRYECVLYTVNKTECSVFIKEKYRSPENQQLNSFLLGGNHLTSSGEQDDESLLFLQEDDIGGDDKSEEQDDAAEAEKDYSEERFSTEDIDRLQ